MYPLSERATRKKRIDTALACAGWAPIQCYEDRFWFEFGAVEEYPTANGPADYVLFSKGRPIAIVEAKNLAMNRLDTLEQAAMTKAFRGEL